MHQVLKDDVGTDAKVDQARHLVDVVRLELVDRLNTTQRCAKQAARFKIAIEREIEQRLHVVPGELANVYLTHVPSTSLEGSAPPRVSCDTISRDPQAIFQRTT